MELGLRESRPFIRHKLLGKCDTKRRSGSLVFSLNTLKNPVVIKGKVYVRDPGCTMKSDNTMTSWHVYETFFGGRVFSCIKAPVWRIGPFRHSIRLSPRRRILANRVWSQSGWGSGSRTALGACLLPRRIPARRYPLTGYHVILWDPLCVRVRTRHCWVSRRRVFGGLL